MIGTLIRGRYEITELLSSSPVFDNYAAVDRTRGAEVCIRVVRMPFATEPEFVKALEQVVHQTRTLDHPNIAHVYELDEHEGAPFVACELIRGASLAERIARVAPFSPSVAVEMAIGICEALEHARAQGLPHGDLCSDHVLTTLDGRVAVIDFGLWQSYGASKSAGGIVLSRMAPYLAPEIIEGELPTYATDVYAVGVILFELLTGRLPFPGPTAAAVLAKHVNSPVPVVKELNAAVPEVLSQIVMKALSKEPLTRYSHCGSLVSDLRKLLDALRFGKQLSWPLSGGGDAVTGPKTFGEQKQEQKLGPAVHAATYKGEKKVAPRKQIKAIDREPDDVPLWFRALVFMFAGMAILAVAFYIFTNLSHAKVHKAPNLVGLNLNEAKSTLQKLNLKLSIIGEKYSEQYPIPQTVLSMDPWAETPIKEGQYIRVVLSLGSRVVEVPDLRGLSVYEAKTRIEAAGLEMDPTVCQKSDDDIPEGLVLNTEPGPAERVERGTAITLTVSTGRRRPRDEGVRAEELIPNTWSLSFKVAGSGAVMVRVEMTDARNETEVIYEEEKQGGDEVVLNQIRGYGKEAIFRIYFNDYLDTTVRRKGTEG